jgi:hypothetical protein
LAEEKKGQRRDKVGQNKDRRKGKGGKRDIKVKQSSKDTKDNNTRNNTSIASPSTIRTSGLE